MLMLSDPRNDPGASVRGPGGAASVLRLRSGMLGGIGWSFRELSVAVCSKRVDSDRCPIRFADRVANGFNVKGSSKKWHPWPRSRAGPQGQGFTKDAQVAAA